MAAYKSILLCDPDTAILGTQHCDGEIRKLTYVSEETLAVATDEHVMLLNIPDGTVIKQLDHPQTRALAAAPDGNTIAIGGYDGSVVLWDLKTGKSAKVRVPGGSSYPWTVPGRNLGGGRVLPLEVDETRARKALSKRTARFR